MTIKEIRIISKKRQELSEKVNPISLIKFIATKEVSKEDLENKESIRSQIESIESIGRMQLLDELMKEMGYDWNPSEKHYFGKSEKNKSYADAWDEVTGRKKDSEDDETDEDDSDDNEESCKDDEDKENCDECNIRDICPIREKKDGTTIVHHHDEVKDKDFKRELLNNPDMRIMLKNHGIAIIGEANTMSLMNLVCELLKIISKSGAGAVRATIDLYNMKTTDKTLKLHLRRQKEED